MITIREETQNSTKTYEKDWLIYNPNDLVYQLLKVGKET